MTPSTTEMLAQNYLTLKKSIEVLEAKLKETKEKLHSELDGKLDVGGSFEAGGVRVTMVKGRTTTKLDRKELVKLGVSGAVLDAATKSQTFGPTLRVTEVNSGSGSA